MYALPGLTSLFSAESLDAFTVAPLPQGSTLRVALASPRADVSVTAAAPQIPASGQLVWDTQIKSGRDLPSQYRVAGTLTSETNRIQGSVFVAGALIGIAGAALLRFFEMVIDQMINLNPDRSRRSKRSRR
jgi:hypothetical protein